MEHKFACLPSPHVANLLSPRFNVYTVCSKLQTECSYNKKTATFDVRVNSGCAHNDQVLICYGPHSDWRLLLEYGFVVPIEEEDGVRCANANNDVMLSAGESGLWSWCSSIARKPM